MHVQLATLAQASVLQLRDVLRRVTVLKLPVQQAPRELPRRLGADVIEATRTDWEETRFDIRHIQA